MLKYVNSPGAIENNANERDLGARKGRGRGKGQVRGGGRGRGRGRGRGQGHGGIQH